jgi:hypothetical protein
LNGTFLITGAGYATTMRRLDLYHHLPDNEAAIQWCRNKELLMKTMQCPQCNEKMKLIKDPCDDGEIWSCSRQRNGIRHFKKLSIRNASFFAGSHISIKDIVYIIYEWSVMTSVQQSAFQFSIGEKTVSSLYKRFRAVAEWTNQERLADKMGTHGDEIEIDECQIGRRKHHRGRKPNEVWVFGGVVRGSNPLRCFIEPVMKRDRPTLTEIIKRRISPDARILSDGWGAYSQLHCREGLNHDVVNHSVGFVSKIDQTIHTQNIENLWRCLRRFLNSREGYKRKHLIGYIQEFIFRKYFADPFEVLISSLAAKHQCS